MRWPAVFVLPGDGTGDRIAGASLSPRYSSRAVASHAVDPAQGTLIPANAIYVVGNRQDRRSPRHRDLLDRHALTDPLFDAPSSIDEIVAAGEVRRMFH